MSKYLEMSHIHSKFATRNNHNDMEHTKEGMVEMRRGYMPSKQADEIQARLIAIYKKEYKPQHSRAQYYAIIVNNEVGEIKERHSQDNNYPDTVYECFSVVSQHVHGFTKEHCLDQVFDAKEREKSRLKEYKLLPTLQELLDSSEEFDPQAKYKTKEKETYPDSCCIYTGDELMKIKKIGIKEYWHIQNTAFINWLLDKGR